MPPSRPYRDRYTLPQLIGALDRAGYTFKPKVSSDELNRRLMPEAGVELLPAQVANIAQHEAQIVGLLNSDTLDQVDKMILAWFVLSRTRRGYQVAVQFATNLAQAAELAELLVANASAEALTEMLAIDPSTLEGIDLSTFIWICWALSSVQAGLRGGAFITLAVTARRHLDRLTTPPAETTTSTKKE